MLSLFCASSFISTFHLRISMYIHHHRSLLCLCLPTFSRLFLNSFFLAHLRFLPFYIFPCCFFPSVLRSVLPLFSSVRIFCFSFYLLFILLVLLSSWWCKEDLVANKSMLNAHSLDVSSVSACHHQRLRCVPSSHVIAYPLVSLCRKWSYLF
jgi:hypothetical protein